MKNRKIWASVLALCLVLAGALPGQAGSPPANRRDSPHQRQRARPGVKRKPQASRKPRRSPSCPRGR